MRSKSFIFQKFPGGSTPNPARDSAPGPHWRLRPQTPAIARKVPFRGTFLANLTPKLSWLAHYFCFLHIWSTSPHTLPPVLSNLVQRIVTYKLQFYYLKYHYFVYKMDNSKHCLNFAYRYVINSLQVSENIVKIA